MCSSDLFARGCWAFQCDDPFPVILDRYIRTREERLAAIRKASPDAIYFAEDVDGSWVGDMFSTFEGALASVNPPVRADDAPPWIIRRSIDEPSGEILEAELTRGLEIAEITAKRYHDAECGRDWGGVLQNGYAHVPHPFQCGDIVRQFGDTYCVLAEDPKDADGRFPHGADWSSMRLQGVTWDRRTGTFAHDQTILFTRHGTELVAPADLPEKERMLAAVSLVMRGEYDLIDFLQRFTCGDREALEKEAIAAANRVASSSSFTHSALVFKERL